MKAYSVLYHVNGVDELSTMNVLIDNNETLADGVTRKINPYKIGNTLQSNPGFKIIASNEIRVGSIPISELCIAEWVILNRYLSEYKSLEVIDIINDIMSI
jgi:hypothetical protein